MNSWLSLGIGVVVVLLITAATAYFVAQEFAYMAVDRSRLSARAAAGDAGAERTLSITRRTSFLLSGAQLGITVTGLLVGYVAEPLIGEAIGDIVGGKLVSTGIALALGSILALLFSTFVQMLFGELYPKNYSIARADQVAAKLSRSTSIYLKVFGPVIWVFDKAAELFLRMLRIEPVHDVEHSATAIDLEHVVEESRERGELTSEQARVLDRILDFPRQNVEHAMRPRAHVDVVRDTATVGEVRELMATGHTRYPVLNDEEYILGVVHLVDVLDVTDFALPVTAIARPPLVLSALMDLPAALEQMDDQREVLACIVDEYGGFAGILTVEDLAEEIVGELTDEHDPADEFYQPTPDDGIWVMSGEVHVDEVERALHVDLPEGDFETVAGLIIDAHGSLPEQGDVVEIELPAEGADLVADEPVEPQILRAEVLEVEHYVPSRVRLTLPEQEAAHEDTPPDEDVAADDQEDRR
ncbi:hemolysin family protein [Calidifontibacter indicus]|uniref:CBS domain containing-hemolysin-like protein n=1 Tax=Calidifontibacter indicus TaxID=419650 RepID=A0A3D9UMU8_9MICO|nr:hemolysin family protein [Calidifontibacter indicus]REF29310.1 CBS domain containing-hemolysin-like protein [Calidifontibacter indicus]